MSSSKRILLVAMSLIVAFGGLAGCSPSAQEKATSSQSTGATTVEATAPVVSESTSAPAEKNDAPTVAAEMKGGKLVFSGTKPGTRLDPHLDTDWEVLYALSPIYDTLVYQAADGSFVPGLATEWTVSEDGLTYTFVLRDDVQFHDGTPFNAEAVQYNLERIKSLAAKSEKAGSLIAAYKSSEVSAPNTIAVQLSAPDGFFLYALSLPYISMVSPTAAEQWGDEYHLHQIGTGPFMFKEYVPEDHYTLVPNPDYNWAPSIYDHQGPAYLEQITWKFLPEPATRAPALEAGDVDVAIDIAPTDSGRISSSPDHSIMTAALTGQPAYWFMNTQLAPTDDIRVRQAILHAADMQAAVGAVMRSLNPVAYGPLAAVTTEYVDDVQGMYPYDVEKAKSLLEEAGWVDANGDGIREKDGKPLTILMSTQAWGQSKPFSEIVQSQLKSVGIDVELESLSFAAQMEAGSSGTKNMLFMGGSGYSAADSLRPYFHSENVDAGFAWAKMKDLDLDALLDQGAKSLDPSERLRIYGEIQVRIMDQALIVPIYDYALLVGVSNKVQGLSWRSVGLVPTLYDTYVQE